MKRPVTLIAVTALVLGILFDYLIFAKTPGISIALYTLVVIMATIYLARQYHSKLGGSMYGLLIIALFFAFMVGIRASGWLTFLNILLITYLLLLALKLATHNAARLPAYGLRHYFSRLAPLIPRAIRTGGQEVQNTLSTILRSRHKSSYVPYVRGIAFSLPILAVLLILLSSADLVFQRYVRAFLDVRFDGEIIFRIVLIGFIAAIFLGAYVMIFSRPKVEEAEGKTVIPILGTTETVIILGSVGMLFLVFVLIQAAYLFGGASQLASTSFTYAEYARKGFFELITVAVITMALIWAVKQSGRHDTPRGRIVLKSLCALLIVEVLIIMLSAHMRLSLYESAYGFTELRLLSHMFIVFLAVTFVSLFIHIYRSEPEHRFAFRSFISVIAFFAILNIINPDALIARQNIDRFTRTGKIDTSYLQNLSDDAAPELRTLLTHPDPSVRNDVTRIFTIRREAAEAKQVHWQSYNLARDKADEVYRDL